MTTKGILRLAGRLTVALGVIGFAVAMVSGQSNAPASPKASTAATAKAWTVPKTPWGDPDLQGVWTSDDMLSIPMQRPEQFAGRAELTDQEFAERQKRDQQALERNRNSVGAFRGDVGTRTFRQTSIVVEPADGRIPPVTPEAQGRLSARQLLAAMRLLHGRTAVSTIAASRAGYSARRCRLSTATAIRSSRPRITW
jgi:hypothetical protein